jgi:hypothetical protein
MERAVVLAVAVAILFAGCTKPDGLPLPESGDGGPADSDADPVLAGLQPPTWSTGHYWRYTSSLGIDFDFVVTQATGDDYILDTTIADNAWYHYLNEVSYIGAIRKSDLAGSQGTDRVRYFDFPLEKGKSWKTDWDGVERTITITAAGKTFDFEAREGERLAVSYTYDPAKGWFTKSTFHGDEGDETVTLAEHRTGWTGEVHRWTAEGPLMVSTSGAVGSAAGSLPVAEGTTDILARVQWSCEGIEGRYVLTLGLIPPTSTEDGIILVAQCEVLDEHLHFEEPTPGDWQADVRFLAPEGGETTLHVWARTLHTLSVP